MSVISDWIDSLQEAFLDTEDNGNVDTEVLHHVWIYMKRVEELRQKYPTWRDLYDKGEDEHTPEVKAYEKELDALSWELWRGICKEFFHYIEFADEEWLYENGDDLASKVAHAIKEAIE